MLLIRAKVIEDHTRSKQFNPRHKKDGFTLPPTIVVENVILHTKPIFQGHPIIVGEKD